VIGQRPPKQTPADIREARRLVEKRDGGACVKCLRTPPGLNWDHRLNRSQGGKWELVNGQLLCGSGTTGCHGFITGSPGWAVRNGYSVPGWADPAWYPAQRSLPTTVGTMRLGWVLYLPVLDDVDFGFREIGADDARERMAGLNKEVA
jgi:hypothetical protein